MIELSFHITESNVWLKREKGYEAQAKTFGAIVKALLKKRHMGVVTWNVWNLSDGDSSVKMKQFDSCLFYLGYRAKPAYYVIQDLLENPPEPK